MTTHRCSVGTLSSLVAAGLLFGGCSIINTVKDIVDITTDVTSSTSANAWFDPEGMLKQDKKILAFTAFNFQNLKQDVAQGQGEYVESLGALLGIPDTQKQDFGSWTQTQYPVLLPSDATTADQFVLALNQALSTSTFGQ
jgi:hypothetical protein